MNMVESKAYTYINSGFVSAITNGKAITSIIIFFVAGSRGCFISLGLFVNVFLWSCICFSFCVIFYSILLNYFDLYKVYKCIKNF